MKIEVEIQDEVTAGLRAMKAGLADSRALHSVFAFAGENALRDHLDAEGYLAYKNKLGGKSTGFYKGVHDSIASESDDDTATVSVNHRGAALRYYGGTVRPVTRKALSIPVEKSAHGLNASEYPQDLLFIPAGPNADSDTAGYLFLKQYRDRKDGKPGTVAEPGEMIYVLRKETTHAPDPNLLPSEADLREKMVSAALDYLDALSDDAGDLNAGGLS